jgi:hypothetical protein
MELLLENSRWISRRRILAGIITGEFLVDFSLDYLPDDSVSWSTLACVPGIAVVNW